MNLSSAVSAAWTLEEVYLYRPGKAGYIVYNPDAAYWDVTGKHAKKAHVPGGVIPDDYTQDKYKYETVATEKSSLLNTIYAFETVATGERMKTTALVVGLKKGENKTEYYRIDIKKDGYNAPVEEFKADVLRNFRYEITINDVKNAGKDNPDTAYEGDTGYTLEATVDAWNDDMKQNVVMDGKYSLTVSHDKLHFGSDGGSPVLELTTNYDGDYDKKNGNDGGHPAGIFIDPPTGGLPSWLTITDKQETKEGDIYKVKIKVTAEENITGNPRTETSFTVRAGNMRYTIKVNQDKDPWLTWSVPTLYVMDSDYKAIDISANFPWTAEIGANPNTTLISVETPSGEATAQKDVIFRTVNRYEKLKNNPIANVPPQYVEENTTIVFKDPLGVNVDKTVEMILACPVDFGESNCYMIDANNPRPLRIPLSQVERAMGDKPGDTADPGYIGNDWIENFNNLKTMYYWGSTETSLIKLVHLRNKGSLSESDIIVIPGNVAGNCGIILFEENDGKDGYFYQIPSYTDTKDMIRWSWHLWISDYYPYNSDLSTDGLHGVSSTDNINSAWMDRNIGALSNIPGDFKTAGFYYHWGCKNPFETVKDWSNDRMRMYFEKRSNGEFLYGVYHLGLSNDNLAKSIYDPTRLFGGGGPNFDWYGDMVYTPNGDLWGHGNAQNYISYTGKSVYDPCPAGYMVPPESSWDTAWNASTKGMINANCGGYYPKAGEIEKSAVSINGVGWEGFYWTATPYGTSSRALIIDNENLVRFSYRSRAEATPIRCIAENP